MSILIGKIRKQVVMIVCKAVKGGNYAKVVRSFCVASIAYPLFAPFFLSSVQTYHFHSTQNGLQYRLLNGINAENRRVAA